MASTRVEAEPMELDVDDDEIMDTSPNPFDDILMDTCDGVWLCGNSTGLCLFLQDIQGLCKYCWVRANPV